MNKSTTILISSGFNLEDNSPGYQITISNTNNKKTINNVDFFPDNSEIEVAVQKLKKLLIQYFNTVDTNAPTV